MTTSFPAVGKGGLGAEAWASTFGSRDGIVEDYTGKALSMTFDNATNEAVFTSGGAADQKSRISNNGYTLVVEDGFRVALPPPSSGSITYYIGSLYDPDLNVPLPNTDPPQADPNGPCRLVALTNPGAQVTGGKRFLVAYNVTRTTAALSGSTVLDRRRWVGTTIDFADSSAFSDQAPGNEGGYPRGTFRMGTRRILVRTLNSAGTGLTWDDPLNDAPLPFPLASGYVARKDKGAPPQYYRFSGSMIGFQGQLQLQTGGDMAGKTHTLGTMPIGMRPDYQVSCPIKMSGFNSWAELRVNSDGTTDGKVILTDPGFSPTTWIDLSPVKYRIGA